MAAWSKMICKGCGKEFDVKTKYVTRGEGTCCSRKCSGIYAASLRPSAESRSAMNTKARDIYTKHYGLPTCQHCGSIPADVHHMDENVKNNDLDNLMALCRSCHIKYHNHVTPKRQKKAA